MLNIVIKTVFILFIYLIILIVIFGMTLKGVTGHYILVGKYTPTENEVQLLLHI